MVFLSKMTMPLWNCAISALIAELPQFFGLVLNHVISRSAELRRDPSPVFSVLVTIRLTSSNDRSLRAFPCNAVRRAGGAKYPSLWLGSKSISSS